MKELKETLPPKPSNKFDPYEGLDKAER